MYRFINKEGIMAYKIEVIMGLRSRLGVVVNNMDTREVEEGAANKYKAGMANADPINVWGRVNCHKVIRKEENDDEVEVG
jgi:hypothetical protein